MLDLIINCYKNVIWDLNILLIKSGFKNSGSLMVDNDKVRHHKTFLLLETSLCFRKKLIYKMKFNLHKQQCLGYYRLWYIVNYVDSADSFWLNWLMDVVIHNVNETQEVEFNRYQVELHMNLSCIDLCGHTIVQFVSYPWSLCTKELLLIYIRAA